MESNIGSIPCDVCGEPVAAHGKPERKPTIVGVIDRVEIPDRVELWPCHNCENNTRVELLDVDGWCQTCIAAMEE